MARNSDTKFFSIAFAALASFMSAGKGAAAAGVCMFTGPHYRLTSDVRDWSLRIARDGNCNFDFRRNMILSSSLNSVDIERLQLISPPQSGEVTIKDAGLSYIAKMESQGTDSFVIVITGAINSIHGSSTIRVLVSSVGAAYLPRADPPAPPKVSSLAARNVQSVTITASDNDWKPLKVGAGGFLSGSSIAQDGTMVVRTDTYGAYLWNGTEWQQLVTATSMPAGFVASSEGSGATGVYAIQVAPSDSNIMYMVYPATTNTWPPMDGVYKSTDKGATWTLTSFTPLNNTNSLNANGPYRMWGQNMGIDPNNPNIVYVGTGANGLFVTTDGGNTWSSVSGVPAGISDSNGQYPGITGILFDPANTNIIFAASYGNGIYETTNDGTSWSKLSSGPSSVKFAAISSNGTYYAIDNSENLWAFANNVWTEVLPANPNQGWNVAGVAVDPFNPNHVVVTTYNGTLNESFNDGSSWSGWSGSANRASPNYVANDIPYQSTFGTDAVGLAFSPTTPGVLYINGDRSFWTTTLSGNITTSTVPTWTDQGIGIEQLVANEIIVAGNGQPLAASWDTAVVAPGSTYASTFGPVQDANVVAGWSIDYASSNPNFIVLLANGSYAGGPERSSYSTNDGQTWTPFPTVPPGASSGGNIAASTPLNFIYLNAGGQPYYTLDGGNTWNLITLPGVSSYSNLLNVFSNARVVTADRVLANTFYLLDIGTGLFKTTNGGVTWTLINTSVNTLDPSYVMGTPQIESTPGVAGDLWIATGQNGGQNGSLLHSTDGGSTWTAIANVVEPMAIGFGAPAPGQSYPAIYIAGLVNGVYGVWQSINDAQSWTLLGIPNGSLDSVRTISGDPNVYGKVYVGFGGSGYAYLRPLRRTKR